MAIHGFFFAFGEEVKVAVTTEEEVRWVPELF